ncbi:MAG: hypothetical protein IJ764_03520 [Bacteroidales bacterium]|nr:hypothetical protein [Bacteroidales bacterium]
MEIRSTLYRAARYILFFTLMLPMAAPAQLYNVWDRAYSNVGIGGNLYINDDGNALHHIGYTGEVGIGVNLFDNLGARIGGLMTHNKNAENIESNYLSLHADLTIHLSNLLYGKQYERRDNLQGIIGLGFMHRQENYHQSADNEFAFIPGLSYTHTLFNGLYFLAELKAYIYMSAFDFNESLSSMVLFTAGVQHRFNDNPYRNGINSGAHSMKENWYGSASVGFNSLQYAGLTMADRLHLLRPALEVSVGKYLSPVIGARFNVLGIQAASANSSFSIANAHMDLMFNINNMVYPKQNRPLSFSAYIGAGVIDRFDKRVLTMSADAGLLTRIWMTNYTDITIDLRYMATTPKFVNDMGIQSRLSVGMFSVMVGYCFNFTEGNLR